MHKRTKRQQMLTTQIGRLESRSTQLKLLSDRIARARLILFVLAALVSAFTFISWGAVPWVLVSVVAFIPFLVMVVSHRRVDTAVTRLTLLQMIKRHHLARMTLAWADLPPAQPVPERMEHPFAHDFDLLGSRSLHHLLNTSASEEGSDRLRDWLLQTTPDGELIASRQALVSELAERPLFRDKLSLKAALVQREGLFSGRQMMAWLAEAVDPGPLRPLLIGLTSLAGINITLFVLGLMGTLPNVWVIPWIIYVGIYATLGSRGVGDLFRESLILQDGLEMLQSVFGFLESYRFGRGTHLQALCQPFFEPAARPSTHIRRAKRVLAGIGAQQNIFLGFLLNAIVPWNLFFAYHMALSQRDLAERLPIWLDIWTELEALNSLATFSWLNPGVAHFPEIWTETAVAFEGQQIGHPLVKMEERVCNDYALDGPGSLTIITGSNMAGKSTFLRTLGVNLVLAYAGGPVVADKMQTSLFRLFASIRVADSLTDGYSFFYAEVRRLEQLLHEYHRADALPLFFLIDEIFRGTNNRERLIGSRAYIRALVNGNGAGLIATHDLELVHLEEESDHIRNFHFRDDVADGRMVFDYKLHPGPCPTTNALKIMALAGLPVPEAETTQTAA